MKTRTVYCLFGVLAAVFLGVQVLTLHAGHNWGDDFAQYLIHARNILQGRAYSSGLGLDHYVPAPPGFPLMLAALMHFFGPNLVVLKASNVIFWLLNTFVLYLLVEERLGRAISVPAAILFLCSYFFFSFKQNILTDVPFLFFVTADVYLFTRYVRLRRGLWLGAALLCLFGAVMTRWAGGALLLSAVFYFVFIKRDAPALLGLGLTAAAIGLVMYGVGFHTQAYQKALLVSLWQWLGSSGRQIMEIPVRLTRFFLPSPLPPNYTALISQMYKLQLLSAVTAVVLAGGVAWLFVLRTVNKSLSFLGCFFAFYFFSYVVWWIPGGGRYLLPIVGLFFILACEIFNAFYTGLFHRRWKIFRVPPVRIIIAAVGVMIVCNLVNIGTHFHDQQKGIYAPAAVAMEQWVRKNVAPDEHYMFGRPRALAWLTGRTGASFVSPQTKEGFIERVRRFKVNYVITNSHNPAYAQALRAAAIPYHPVYRNDRFIIYRINWDVARG